MASRGAAIEAPAVVIPPDEVKTGHAKRVVVAVVIDHAAGIAVDDHQAVVALMDAGAAALDVPFSFWPAREGSVASADPA